MSSDHNEFCSESASALVVQVVRGDCTEIRTLSYLLSASPGSLAFASVRS